MSQPVSLTADDVRAMVQEQNSQKEVARQLGKHHSWVQRRLKEAERGDGGKQYDLFIDALPDLKEVLPEDLLLKRRSTLTDAEGNTKLEWNISCQDEQKRLERIKKALEHAAERLPRHAPVPAPEFCMERLCNFYTITDYHLGMYAHESLNHVEDWSTKKAKDYIVRAFELMVTMAPRAKRGIINIQGDFLHTDGLWPCTPTSGHMVDQDTRYEEMPEIAADVIERVIDLALSWHDEVVVVIAEGNHDLSGSAWLRTMFNRIYKDEPRVEVDTRKDPYYGLQWGNVGLFIHHGHKLSIKKSKEVSLLFAHRFREIWGSVKKCYGHFGHYHHEDVREESGIILRQHPTLAPDDSHGQQMGYNSERAARFITYDMDAGEWLSGRITPEMVDAV